MVGCVVVMIGIVALIGRISRAVAVAVMVRVRLCMIVRWFGVAVGSGKKMDGKPGHVKHQREHRQPPAGLQ